MQREGRRYVGGFGSNPAAHQFHAAACAALWDRANRPDKRWDHEMLRVFTGRLLNEASLRTADGGFASDPSNQIVARQLQDIDEVAIATCWGDAGGTPHVPMRDLKRYVFLVSLQALAHAGSGDTETPGETPAIPDGAILEWLWSRGVHQRHVPDRRDLTRLVDGMLTRAQLDATPTEGVATYADTLGALRRDGRYYATRTWANLSGIPYNMPDFELRHFADALSLFLDGTLPAEGAVTADSKTEPERAIEEALRSEAPELGDERIARLVDRLAQLL